MRYQVTTPKGEQAQIEGGNIERFLLRINGGGYHMHQTVNAIQDNYKLDAGETVTRNGWTIRKEP